MKIAEGQNFIIPYMGPKSRPGMKGFKNNVFFEKKKTMKRKHLSSSRNSLVRRSRNNIILLLMSTQLFQRGYTYLTFSGEGFLPPQHLLNATRMTQGTVRMLLQATFLSLASSFINHFFRHLAIPSKNTYTVSHMSKAEWSADDDGPASFRDISSQRKLNGTFINNLVRHYAVGVFINTFPDDLIHYKFFDSF